MLNITPDCLSIFVLSFIIDFATSDEIDHDDHCQTDDKNSPLCDLFVKYGSIDKAVYELSTSLLASIDFIDLHDRYMRILDEDMSGEDTGNPDNINDLTIKFTEFFINHFGLHKILVIGADDRSAIDSEIRHFFYYEDDRKKYDVEFDKTFFNINDEKSKIVADMMLKLTAK